MPPARVRIEATTEGMSWFYYPCRVMARFLFFVLTRRDVTGGENVPPNGPLIVVANHLNNADPPLVGVSFKRQMMMMAKEELFRNPVAGYILRGFGGFPVHRSRFDRRAVRQATEMLDRGMAVLIFPEGTRSPDGRLQPGLPGAALLACLSGAPVLPVGITGTDRLKYLRYLLRRPRVTVNIGKPFYLPRPERLTRESLSRGTALIMERIAGVLPPEYRGAAA